MRLSPLVVLLLVMGCGREVTGPPEAERFDPPSSYAKWWSEVQRDAGKEVGALRIRWYVVPKPWYSESARANVMGSWTRSGKIFIAKQCLEEEKVVKHELLHEWIYQMGNRTGDPEHKHPLFRVYAGPLGCERYFLVSEGRASRAEITGGIW